MALLWLFLWTFTGTFQTTPVRYLTGDAADVKTTTTAGLLLAGGSTDVDSAVAWFLRKSGGGDIVVLRASGKDGYNDYFFQMVPVNSVETIILDSRDKALLPEVAATIRAAEGLFIAGGDQSNYVNFWKDTPVADAINYLINSKKVPVGGTSAGLAILGNAYYSAQFESAKSAEVLADPYHSTVTLGQGDFLHSSFLQQTITDSHYTQRDRQGRHIGFMARCLKDFKLASIKGIGIDEKTALCIDENGIGKVYGSNRVYFLHPTGGGGPETCQRGAALDWYRGGAAINAYVIDGSLTGNGRFDANTWTFGGGVAKTYSVRNGVLASK